MIALHYTRVETLAPDWSVTSSRLARDPSVQGDQALVQLIQTYDPVVWSVAKLPLHEVVWCLAEYDRDQARDREYLPGPDELWS